MVTPLVNTNYAEDIYFSGEYRQSVLKSSMFAIHDMKYIWYLP